MTSLQTIGVIGAGTMGSGIAQACAVVGLSGSLSLEEMQECAPTLFFVGQLPLPWCLRGSYVECSGLFR
jgi:3-hydroxyacyl-CoA dehydrogenase, NAD binding domain